jgi:transposase
MARTRRQFLAAGTFGVAATVLTSVSRPAAMPNHTLCVALLHLAPRPGDLASNRRLVETALGALGAQRLQAVMRVGGPLDTAVFRAYVTAVLGPTLTPGDVVVLDNLDVPKARGIQQMLARRRVQRLYLPPYSPDLAPIEPCWSKVKTALPKSKAHSRGAPDRAITSILPTVTEADARGWLRHCGYALY